jgi:hypothetical protein
MSRVIPFRRQSSVPSFLLTVLGAIAVAVIGFAATMTFLNWQSSPFDFTHVRKGAQSLATQFENFSGPAAQYIGVDQARSRFCGLHPISIRPACGLHPISPVSGLHPNSPVQSSPVQST